VYRLTIVRKSFLRKTNLSFFCLKGWFGLRQDACGWLLHLCPIFETYANIEYHFNSSNSPSTSASLHNVNSTTTNPTIISPAQLNRTIESTRRHPGYSRRFFFRKKSTSFFDQTKTDHDENDIFTTVMLPPLNSLKLHEPD
jgi:hypothetical protein